MRRYISISEYLAVRERCESQGYSDIFFNEQDNRWYGFKGNGVIPYPVPRTKEEIIRAAIDFVIFHLHPIGISINAYLTLKIFHNLFDSETLLQPESAYEILFSATVGYGWFYQKSIRKKLIQLKKSNL